MACFPRRFALGIAVLTALGLAPATAQDLAARARAVLVEHALPLDATALTGPGADWLLDNAARSQVVLLGESHGNRQTPALTAALLRALASRGFGAYGIETGPVSTRRLVALLRDGGTKSAESWLRRQPFTLAFMNWREEVAAVGAAVEARYRVWGLDQEYLGAGRFLLSRLVELAEAPRARELGEQWLRRAQQGFAHFAKTGDRSRGFMAVVSEADFDALDAAFAGVDRAAQILAELRASVRIYRHYAEGRYYRNNRDRAALMKHHLADRLRELDADGGARTKVLLRTGSMHAGRGYSPTRQLDAGNHAAEWAVGRGGDSFHVYVFARRRAGGENRDYAVAAPWLQPVYAGMAEGAAATIFDLRPLRPLLSGEAGRQQLPDLTDLVFRYDAALIFSEFESSTEIVPSRGR